jgi:hypothetical protein
MSALDHPKLLTGPPPLSRCVPSVFRAAPSLSAIAA